MTHEEYLEAAKEFATYPEDKAAEYLLIGLVGEAAELLEAARDYENGVKQKFFSFEMAERRRSLLLKELGDVRWYLTMFSFVVGFEVKYEYKSKDRLLLPSALCNSLSLELGFICNKYKKIMRGETVSIRLNLIEVHELYFSILEMLEVSSSSIDAMNIEKLHGRKERGTLQGNGDDR